MAVPEPLRPPEPVKPRGSLLGWWLSAAIREDVEADERDQR
jgi:hypothetical protein